MRIVEAQQAHISEVRILFREYQQSICVDLCFQKFEEELATLPGCYAPPEGVIMIAVSDEEIIGCVAIRPRTKNEAELKRLYVRAGHQGTGIGKHLFHVAMSRGQALGYKSIVLDTLPTMKVAKKIYAAYGFKKIQAYYDNPEEETEYYRYTFV